MQGASQGQLKAGATGSDRVAAVVLYKEPHYVVTLFCLSNYATQAVI